MIERKYRLPATVALLLGFAALHFILILTALHAVGTDAELYYAEQLRAGILPASGLSDEDLRALDDRLAGYLSGDAAALNEGDGAPRLDAPVVALEVFGVSQPAFNDRERSHLLDCYDLFSLLRKVRSRLIPWAVLLIAGGAYLLRDRRRIRLCAWLSPLLPLIPLGLFALYAALDFDAAFTLFHRILFQNDLWLLDPATDLLIRICPESMFMRMGIRIGAYSLIGMLAVSAVATALTLIRPAENKENTWKTTTRRGPAPKQFSFKGRDAR